MAKININGHEIEMTSAEVIKYAEEHPKNGFEAPIRKTNISPYTPKEKKVKKAWLHGPWSEEQVEVILMNLGCTNMNTIYNNSILKENHSKNSIRKIFYDIRSNHASPSICRIIESIRKNKPELFRPQETPKFRSILDDIDYDARKTELIANRLID